MISKRLPSLVLASFLVLFIFGPAFGAIIHVDSTPGNPSGNWGCPIRTVTMALGLANSGDEIWVAEGTYVERIILKSGVALYGGFVGNETSRDQRNWAANATILDGSARGSVVTATSISGAILDGFTIRNGRAAYGGGVYGGGCLGTLTLSNNTITGNSATAAGGGVYCGGGQATTVSGNVITGNTAKAGGGVYLQASQGQHVLSDNQIRDNSATENGGGICAAATPSTSATVTLSNNTILRNSSNTAGGGAYLSDWQSAMLSGNVVAGNWAAYDGGGVYTGCPSTITNNTITENAANESGGGMCAVDSPHLISNNVIAFNSSGMRVSSNSTLRNNEVYNPAGYNYLGHAAGTGDISTDPKFASPHGWDYHLRSDSPCVNAGWNGASGTGAVDIDGEPRVQPSGGTVDIGADEFNGTEPIAPTPVAVRVDGTSGNDLNDGSTWAAAKKTVQSGVDLACVLGGDVWVKAGVYHERITLKSHVNLLGGFAGDEVAKESRSWATNITALNGDLAGTVVTATSCLYSAVDGFSIVNGKGVASGGGIDCYFAPISISNNTIAGNSAPMGAGISLRSSAATVSNNVIRCNTASGYGGGLYLTNSAAIVSNNTIVANTATSGGGVHNNAGPTASFALSNNVVAYNSSGIYQFGTAPVLRNNDFYNPLGANYTGLSAGVGDISADPKLVPGTLCIQADSPCRDAGWNGAAGLGSVDMAGKTRVFPAGGSVDIGAYEWDGSSSPVVGSVVRVDGTNGNDANDGSSWALAKKTVQSGVDTASMLGGDVWVRAGTYVGQITLKPFASLYGGFVGTEASRDDRNWTANVTILDGNASGSVVSATNMRPSLPIIDGFTIQNGKTTGDGGGIACTYFDGAISHNTIKANSAANGGGISCSYSAATIAGNLIVGNRASASGGGIKCAYLGSSPNAISGNTFVGNTAPTGGAVTTSSLAASFVGNIAAFNSSGISGSFAALRNNAVYNPAGRNYLGTSAGAGDISLDPLFVNSAQSDYHLRSISPCINVGWNDAAGIPAVDMDGEARLNGIIDMGADEYWAGTSRSVTDAKGAGGGSAVDIYGGIVTAAFGDSFYVEADDRVSGILVKKQGHSLQAGNRARIVGNLAAESEPERYIQAAIADPMGTGSVAALAIPAKSIGGGASGLQGGVWGWRTATDANGEPTRVWDQMKGLNNIGLLITTAGKVTGIEPAVDPAKPTWFTIDDGSGLDLKCSVPSSVTIDLAWQYVRVTGISSCERVGAELHAVVKVRTQGDILAF